MMTPRCWYLSSKLISRASQKYVGYHNSGWMIQQTPRAQWIITARHAIVTGRQVSENVGKRDSQSAFTSYTLNRSVWSGQLHLQLHLTQISQIWAVYLLTAWWSCFPRDQDQNSALAVPWSTDSGTCSYLRKLIVRILFAIREKMIAPVSQVWA
jgi:hypothetical protein